MGNSARVTRYYNFLRYFLDHSPTPGFENEVKACCGTGTFEMSYMCDRLNPFTCKDADKYVFWDSFHPSEKTNSILAYDAVMNSLAIFWR